MTSIQIKTELSQSLRRQPVINEAAREGAIGTAMSAWEGADARETEDVSIYRLVLTGLITGGWRALAAELALFAVGLAMSRSVLGVEYIGGYGLLSLLGGCSALSAAMAVIFLYRQSAYKMSELEATAYIPYGRLLFSRIAPIFIGNAALLFGAMGYVGLRGSIAAAPVLLSGSIPALLLSALAAGWYRRFGQRGLMELSAVVCTALIIALFSLHRGWEIFFSPTITGVGIACMAGLFLVTARQLRSIFYMGCCETAWEV